MLSNLRLSGKESIVAEGYDEDDKERDVISIQLQLTRNMVDAEFLQKLVLQDIPLCMDSQRNLVVFVEKNHKIENL